MDNNKPIKILVAVPYATRRLALSFNTGESGIIDCEHMGLTAGISSTQWRSNFSFDSERVTWDTLENLPFWTASKTTIGVADLYRAFRITTYSASYRLKVMQEEFESLKLDRTNRERDIKDLMEDLRDARSALPLVQGKEQAKARDIESLEDSLEHFEAWWADTPIIHNARSVNEALTIFKDFYGNAARLGPYWYDFLFDKLENKPGLQLLSQS
jgi:hypothetical protein